MKDVYIKCNDCNGEILIPRNLTPLQAYDFVKNNTTFFVFKKNKKLVLVCSSCLRKKMHKMGMRKNISISDIPFSSLLIERIKK